MIRKRKIVNKMKLISWSSPISIKNYMLKTINY